LPTPKGIIFRTASVSRVALLLPVLGKVLPRNPSHLKPILVEEVWDRVKNRLVP